jgi:hypothetical protein
MDFTSNESLRLLETASGGLSLKTVEYKGRLLYSKYNPSRAVVSLIQKTQILPGTLVLVNSPCLFYGLAELAEKAHGCRILALEAEKPLLTLAETVLSNLPEKDSVHLHDATDFPGLDALLRDYVKNGSIRRVLPLDFSAGTAFAPKVYQRIFEAAAEITGSFWKNRITIVKMGRLFTKNIFTNLLESAKANYLSDAKGITDKPIVVFGAGESIDETCSNKDFFTAAQQGKFFILAVDAALASLLDRGLHVDAVVGMESQFAIQKAYLGARGSGITYFADLCSRPQIPRILSGQVFWYTSAFSDTAFIPEIQNQHCLPDLIPPLGSVGLTAVYIALVLRKNQSVPVYLTGLDFSYSIGKTHAKGTPAHKGRLIETKRLLPVENYDAAYSPAAFKATGKNGKEIVSTKILSTYARTLSEQFFGVKSLFDASNSGLPLAFEKAPENWAVFSEKSTWKDFRNVPPHPERIDAAEKWYENEQESLKRLRSLLSEGDSSQYRNQDTTLEEQVKNLLSTRDYLFLHFPDGYALSMEENFLKRVRAEIDVFLKIISKKKAGNHPTVSL